MPVIPWNTFEAPLAGIKYVAMVSRLPLQRHFALFKSIRLATEIRGQLSDSPGLIGYSLEAAILSKTLWTLSAWRDQASLRNFVKALPHSRVMSDMVSDMGEAKFSYWIVEANEIPLHWANAKARLRPS
jgi:hypothetical protein